MARPPRDVARTGSPNFLRGLLTALALLVTVPAHAADADAAATAEPAMEPDRIRATSMDASKCAGRPTSTGERSCLVVHGRRSRPRFSGLRRHTRG